MLEDEMHPCIQQVVAEKKQVTEGELHERIPKLDAWISRTFTWLEERAEQTPSPQKPDWALLDKVFLNIISI